MRSNFQLTVKAPRALLLFVVVLFTSNVHAQTVFSRMVVFGDSLSDTGNIAGALTPNLPPPYFDNRISNGVLAVDMLANELGLSARAASDGGDNWAVVGGNIVGLDLGDLQRQVDRYQQRDGQRDESSTLFVIFMGGNDLRDLRGVLDTSLANARISETVDQLLATVRRLQNSGAEHFLIVNVADIGRIPQTLEQESVSPGVSTRVNAYVQRFNELLKTRLEEQARNGRSEFYLLDLFTKFAEVLNQPAQFGFTIADRGCFDPGDGFNPLEFSFDTECDSGFYPVIQPDFSGYVFFDSLHPTAAMHGFVGSWMKQALENPPLGVARVNLSGVLLLLLDD